MVWVPKKTKSINALGHRRGRRGANRYNAEQLMAEKLWKRGWKQIPDPETTGSMSDYWPGLAWTKDDLMPKNVYEACHFQASLERKAKYHLKPENMAKYLIEKGWKQSGPLADVWTTPHWKTKRLGAALRACLGRGLLYIEWGVSTSIKTGGLQCSRECGLKIAAF